MRAACCFIGLSLIVLGEFQGAWLRAARCGRPLALSLLPCAVLPTQGLPKDHPVYVARKRALFWTGILFVAVSAPSALIIGWLTRRSTD
jgi:hypothetical protein